jgi:hypothetical protein
MELSGCAGMARPQKTKDEVRLEKLAKRLLSMPHKPREESKIGKAKTPKPRAKAAPR